MAGLTSRGTSKKQRVVRYHSVVLSKPKKQVVIDISKACIGAWDSTCTEPARGGARAWQGRGTSVEIIEK